MAQNSLYPGYVKLYYEASGHPHIHTFGITAPTGGLGTSTITNKGGTAVATATAIAAYVAALKTLYSASTNFRYWELFKMNNSEDPGVLIDTGSLNIPGTNATGSVLYGQTTMSYRSDTGGFGKLVLMETSQAVNTVVESPFAAGPYKTIADYIVSASGIVTARDNGFPMMVTKAIGKTNDALRKKYFLNLNI